MLISSRITTKYSGQPSFQRHFWSSFTDRHFVFDNNNGMLFVETDKKEKIEYSLKNAKVLIDYFSPSTTPGGLSPPALVLTCFVLQQKNSLPLLAVAAATVPSVDDVFDVVEIVFHFQSVTERDQWYLQFKQAIEQHLLVLCASADRCMRACMLEMKHASSSLIQGQLQLQLETQSQVEALFCFRILRLITMSCPFPVGAPNSSRC